MCVYIYIYLSLDKFVLFLPYKHMTLHVSSNGPPLPDTSSSTSMKSSPPPSWHASVSSNRHADYCLRPMQRSRARGLPSTFRGKCFLSRVFHEQLVSPRAELIVQYAKTRRFGAKDLWFEPGQERKIASTRKSSSNPNKFVKT